MPDQSGGLFPVPITTQPSVPLEEMALRLGYSALLGVAVAAVYFLTQRRKRAEAASFVSTLVLLTILLAMVSMVIGSDIARAFSLVGALSIVRFRTVVEDTRDTAFVIFAVIAGMAAGAGAYWVPVMGVPLMAVVAWMLVMWGEGGTPPSRPASAGAEPSARFTNTLIVRMGIGFDPEGALTMLLAEHVEEARLLSVGTARQGAAVDLTYAIRMKPTTNPVTLLAAVNRVEGVQNVEWTVGEKR